MEQGFFNNEKHQQPEKNTTAPSFTDMLSFRAEIFNKTQVTVCKVAGRRYFPAAVMMDIIAGSFRSLLENMLWAIVLTILAV